MIKNTDIPTIANLHKDLRLLKSAYEMPRIHLVDTLSVLTFKIDIAFEEYLPALMDKARINQSDIVDRVQAFERECLAKLPTNEFEASFSRLVGDKIKDCEIKVEKTSCLDHDEIMRVSEEIQRTFLMVQGRIFGNKMLRFVDQVVKDKRERQLFIIEGAFFGERRKPCIFTAEDLILRVIQQTLTIMMSAYDEDNHQLIITNPEIYAFNKEASIQTIHLANWKQLEITSRFHRTDDEFSGFDSNIFSMLPNLTELDISCNLLAYLESSAFRGVSNLVNLNLSCNEFTSYEPNIFKGLSQLKDLDLSINFVAELESNIFEGLSSLEFLDLNTNRFQGFDSNIFKGLANLVELDLACNSLTSFEPNIFKGLSNLARLNLSDNLFTSFEANVFSGLSNLSMLDFSRNQFASSESIAFQALGNKTVIFRSDTEKSVCQKLQVCQKLSDEAEKNN